MLDRAMMIFEERGRGRKIDKGSLKRVSRGGAAGERERRMMGRRRAAGLIEAG